MLDAMQATCSCFQLPDGNWDVLSKTSVKFLTQGSLFFPRLVSAIELAFLGASIADADAEA
ncbi:MAG: hypothetical protein M3Q07_21605, partial [Pseudobdellovibrionaceae bacterium]|nr:hypothetical protein [Pseudobdellovibrionaceae bacterium]